MALNTGFWITEGLRGIGSHKLTAAISIAGLTLSLWLIGVLLLVGENLAGYKQSLFSEFQMDVFIDVTSVSSEHQLLQEQIAAIEGITKIDYVSKDEAAKIFARDFGEELFAILDDNPLPASFKLTLSPEYRDYKKADTIIKSLYEIQGVDEVVFQGELLDSLNRRFQIFSNIVIVLAAVIFIASIAIFLQGIALSLKARANFVRTTLLSGAKSSAVRIPFIIEGVISGLIAGLISFIAVVSLNVFVNNFITPFHFFGILYFLIPAGFCIGIIVSVISVSVNFIKFKSYSK